MQSRQGRHFYFLLCLWREDRQKFPPFPKLRFGSKEASWDLTILDRKEKEELAENQHDWQVLRLRSRQRWLFEKVFHAAYSKQPDPYYQDHTCLNKNYRILGRWLW